MVPPKSNCPPDLANVSFVEGAAEASLLFGIEQQETAPSRTDQFSTEGPVAQRVIVTFVDGPVVIPFERFFLYSQWTFIKPANRRRSPCCKTCLLSHPICFTKCRFSIISLSLARLRESWSRRMPEAERVKPCERKDEVVLQVAKAFGVYSKRLDVLPWPSVLNVKQVRPPKEAMY